MTRRTSKPPGGEGRALAKSERPRRATEAPPRPISMVTEKAATASVYERLMDILVRHVGGRLAFAAVNVALLDAELSPDSLTRTELARILGSLMPRLRPFGTPEELKEVEREIAELVRPTQAPARRTLRPQR